MAENTAIEWCDASLSPWWGCTKLSPACAHCYAEAIDARFAGGGHWGKGAPRLRKPNFARDALRLNRKAARLGRTLTVFPSMCDPFDEEVPIEMFADFLDVIHRTQNLTWLLLTKRPENFVSRLVDATYPEGSPRDLYDWASKWIHGMEIPSNVWIGTTVEDQQRADERIPHLLQIPARVRFLSCEPLLGPVDLTAVKLTVAQGYFGDCLEWYHRGKCHLEMEIAYPVIHWVICGGESGPNARPMRPVWARSLRDQCAAAGVAFFMKQMGGARKPFPEIPQEIYIREFPHA